MKHFKMIFVKSLLLITCSLYLHTFLFCEQMIQLSDSDIKSLNLSEKDAQEFQQFINVMNSLPPEEQEILNKLTQEVSNQMRQKGLDPDNPEDVFKYVEEQQAALGQQPPALEPMEPAAESKPTEDVSIACPKPSVIAANSPEETMKMLNTMRRHLSKFHQKASEDEQMRNRIEGLQQEIRELKYFLNVLTQPDLLVHLTSQEFLALHKNLECLYNSLVTYEPNIILKKATVGYGDDPYEILGVSYNATPEEIELAFKKLKKKYNPKKVAKKLDKQGITGKERTKQIKEARIIFKFIEDAYQILSDENERQNIDLELKSKIEFERKQANSSAKAFENLFSQISMALYQNRLLDDISRLLEKYKPEELAKAKAQEELEKKVAERSKQKVRTPTVPAGAQTTPNTFEQFYQQLAQESLARAYQPQYYRPTQQQYMPQQQQDQPAGPGGEQPKKSDGQKPRDGKKEEKKPEDKDKKSEDKDKKDKKEEKPAGITPKDVDKIGLIELTSKLLEQVKDEIEVEDPTTKKISLVDLSDDAPIEKKKIKLKTILQDLDNYLQSPITKDASKISKDKNIIGNFKLYFEQNKIPEIWANLQQLNPGKDAKIDNNIVKQTWKTKIYDKHAKLIKSWYGDIYGAFNKDLRVEHKKKPINNEKLIKHGLHLDESLIKDPSPKELLKKFPKLEQTDLLIEKKYIKDIYDVFDNLNKSLGITPKAPK